MKVEHILDCAEVNSEFELKQIMKITNNQGMNEFWMSNDMDYPCLCISVNGEFAHVHYFSEEGDPGYQAIGDLELVDDMMVFIANTNEEINIENGYILKKDDAIKVAFEFFNSQDLPKCVKWEEL